MKGFMVYDVHDTVKAYQEDVIHQHYPAQGPMHVSHLRSFRATPHPTTGASPAELLFGRKVKTILPDYEA